MKTKQSVSLRKEELLLYDCCIKRVSEEKTKKQKKASITESLETLDSWWQKELPTIINGRGRNTFINLIELETVMKWKLSRGKFRPLLRLVAQNSDEQVVGCSRRAFAALSRKDLRGAVEALSKLKGVGPATASAVLAAHSPGFAPFMSDEALEAIVGSRQYTLKEYLQLSEQLQSLASSLEGSWNAEQIGKTLWVKSQLQKYPDILQKSEIKQKQQKQHERKRDKSDESIDDDIKMVGKKMEPPRRPLSTKKRKRKRGSNIL